MFLGDVKFSGLIPITREDYQDYLVGIIHPQWGVVLVDIEDRPEVLDKFIESSGSVVFKPYIRRNI